MANLPLIRQKASESTPGEAQFATQAEVDAGTATDKIVTPQGLSSSFEEKVLPASLLSDGDFLEFTGLALGQVYRYTSVINWQVDSGGSMNLYVRAGTTDVKHHPVGFQTGATEIKSTTFVYQFTATETSIKSRVTNITGIALRLVFGNASFPHRSWATLEKLSGVVEI